VAVDDLAALLAGYAPFDSLSPEALKTVSSQATIAHFAQGDVILDAFRKGTDEVFLVIAGRVELWNSADRLNEPPDEHLVAGGLFGFSSVLTERSVGPRAVAESAATVARIPGSVVTPAFASATGARFLAEHVMSARREPGVSTYSLVDDLIIRAPLIVEPTATAAEVARLMTEQNASYSAVRTPGGSFGLVTDTLLRKHILVNGEPPTTPVGQLMDPDPPTAGLGDSAAETLILMLDRDADFVLVTDDSGELRGVVNPRDFAISSTTAGVSLHEQLRRATTLAELNERARRVPGMLGDLLTRGLASDKVIAIYSAVLDTIVRRAIGLTFDAHSELSADAFTWLALGSNGRREGVLSSDVDSAAAFVDSTPPEDIPRYNAVFAEIGDVLAQAGLSRDEHGATAQRRVFTRTNADWRAAAEQWLAAPAENNGAMMTSLLVDGRPIYGDPGLPAVAKVFGDLRRHPGTMRLLLQESLSYRAKMPSMRGLLNRRAGSFDVKAHAVLPIVNLARWAALSAGSAALPTAERLRAAAGSAMLPQDQATTLIEVFEVLQRLRLRYQILQHQRGERPTDVLKMDEVSPIDRSVIAQAVREVSSVQRRMDNISLYVPVEGWTSPESS
jgi:CBS domain-containing protein